MKKLKLFFAALALLVGGANSASADPVGVELSTGSNYYLFNLGSKKYMTVGQIWGSRANVSESEAIPLQITAGGTDGTYKLITKVNGDATGLIINNDPAPYLDDGTPHELIFEKQGDELIYKIKDGSSRYIKWDGTNDALIAGNAETSGDNDKWIITTADNMKADLITRMGQATDLNPVNVTLLVKSARPAWGTSRFWPYTNWTNGNSENEVDRYSGGSAAVMGYWGGSGKDIYQDITVPNGKYKVRCLGYARAGDWQSNYCWNHKDGQNSVVYISSGGNSDSNILPSIFEGAQTTKLNDGCKEYTNDGDVKKYIPNNCKSAAVYFSNHKYTTWAEATAAVENGTVRIGVKNPSSQWEWVEVSQFELLYLEPVVSVNALPLPLDGNIVADQWYKYSVVSTGTYNIAAGTAANIVLTTNGDQLVSTATGSAIETGDAVNLTEGDILYYKSTTDNTLTIEANTKTYVVGDVTATSIADNTYLQALSTVTFTLGDATTNDGTAALAVQGETTAKLKLGETEKATGALSIEGTVVTATFTSVTLDPSSTYTITLPANAIAWDKKTDGDKNTQKVITFKTPAVFDGTYYIKKNDEDLYFSRGGDDNKQTILDAYGVPVTITTTDANVSRVKFVDTGLLLGASGSSNMLWTDKGTGQPTTIDLTIEKSGDNFKFYFEGMVDEKKGVNIDGTTAPKTDTEANAYAWSLELPAAHPAKLQAVKDAKAAAVATAMGFDGISTQAQMKTYVETNYGETPIEITGTGGTIQDKWQYTAPKGTGNETALFVEEIVNGLAPGLYRLRVYGFERIASADNVYAAGGPAGLAYVYATTNSVTEKIKLASLFDYPSDTKWDSNIKTYDGKYYPNNTAGSQKAFDAGNYANDIYVKVVDEGEGTGSIKFGIKQPNCYYEGDAEVKRDQWICFNDFSLVMFETKAKVQEKQDLADAITVAEAKTLGFETGEYAPYNNVAALEALADAKALDPATVSGTAAVAATTALNGATWTANVGEVNAVHNGNFATQQDLGWNFSAWGQFVSGLNANTNASNGTARSSNAGTLTYGSKTGYTMPLEGNTVYRLVFKVASWDNGNKNTGTDVSVLNSSSEGLATKSFGASSTNRDQSGAFKTYSTVFKTGAAGDYTLVITAKGGRSVYTDIELKKMPDQSVSITSAGYATYVNSDYDLDFSATSIEAYKAQVNTTTGVITLTKVENVPAGTPVVLHYESGQIEENIPVMTGAAAVSDNDLKAGTGVAVPTTDGEGHYNYVLDDVSGIGFYKANNVIVASNRAYLQTTYNVANGEARGLRMEIDGEILTGISEAKTEVKAAKEGKFIVDGKLVIFKKGMKFNANGQVIK